MRRFILQILQNLLVLKTFFVQYHTKKNPYKLNAITFIKYLEL